MRELIRLSRRINNLEITGKTIVKSQKLGDSVTDGVAPVGIRYVGYSFPRELSEYIGSNECSVTIWHSKGYIKAFIVPSGNSKK